MVTRPGTDNLSMETAHFQIKRLVKAILATRRKDGDHHDGLH